MKKICLAIGNEGVLMWLKNNIRGDVVFTRDCTNRQAILPTLADELPDILILSEGLSGKEGLKGISIVKLIQEIRVDYSGVRIIFIANEHDYKSPDDTLLDSLVGMGVYDILCNTPGSNKPIIIRDALKMIDTPSSYAYATRFIHKDKDKDEAEESDIETDVVDIVPASTSKKPFRGLLPSPSQTADTMNYNPNGQTPTTPSTVPVVPPITNTTNTNGTFSQGHSKDNYPNPAIQDYKTGNYPALQQGQGVAINTAQGGYGNPQLPHTVNPQVNQTVPAQTATLSDNGQDSGGTTVLISNQIGGLVFRPAIPSDLDSSLSRSVIPGPNNYDGKHLKKNILYSNVQPVRKAKIVTFCGARQGVGTTTVALNVAVILAKNKDKKVLYLDATYTPSVYEKFAAKTNWYGLIHLSERIKHGDNLRNSCVRHVDLKDAVVDPQRLSEIPYKLEYLALGCESNTEIPNATEVINKLAEYYDYVIIDMGLNEATKLNTDILTISDRVMCVSTQDLYEINKLIEVLGRYKQRINLEGKYDVVLTRYVKTDIDIEYLRENIKAGKIYVTRDNTKQYLESSGRWLPLVLSTRKKNIIREYMCIAEGVMI